MGVMAKLTHQQRAQMNPSCGFHTAAPGTQPHLMACQGSPLPSDHPVKSGMT